MKPKELLPSLDMMWTLSIDKKILVKYIDEDCIVAYDLNKLGSIFIIKGKIKSFAFFCLNFIPNHYGYNCQRIELEQAVKLLGDDCNIINEEEYMKIRKKVILNKLNK